MIRALNCSEVNALEPCLGARAEHHNAVSMYFSETFPSRPFAETLSRFGEELASGASRCAVVEASGTVVGLCKIDLEAPKGHIDNLVALDGHRGCGLGDALMTWAIQTLESNGATAIDLKVVYGKDAERFYERYGFKPALLVMCRQ